MKKFKKVILFGAIGFVLAAVSGVVGFYRGSAPDCDGNYNLTCELGPPSANIGLPLSYASGGVDVTTDNEMIDKHFIEGQIIVEPRNLFGIFNSELYMSAHNNLPGVVYLLIDVVFWGGFSWMIYFIFKKSLTRYNNNKS